MMPNTISPHCATFWSVRRFHPLKVPTVSSLSSVPRLIILHRTVHNVFSSNSPNTADQAVGHQVPNHACGYGSNFRWTARCCRLKRWWHWLYWWPRLLTSSASRGMSRTPSFPSSNIYFGLDYRWTQVQSIRQIIAIWRGSSPASSRWICTKNKPWLHSRTAWRAHWSHHQEWRKDFHISCWSTTRANHQKITRSRYFGYEHGRCA